MNLKKEPINYLTAPLYKLISSDSSIGIILFIASLSAVIVSNIAWGESWYYELWFREISIASGDWSFSMNLHHKINNGLMAIFFLWSASRSSGGFYLSI